MSEQFFCSCHNEMIRVEIDEDGMTEFSVWTYGNPGKPALRRRLRWVWRAFWHGQPFGDQTILNAETARSLGEYLLGGSDGSV